MIILSLGLFLWMAVHFWRRIAPNHRAKFGDKGKAIVAVLVVLSIVLMVMGYRSAPLIEIWTPPAAMVHVNNLLMIAAFLLFGMAKTSGRLRGKMRHPQLGAVKVWAFAHLLVNGDLASIILFGGMLAWAVVSVILINKAGPWERPEPGDKAKDWLLGAITIGMFLIVAALHAWAGVWPFPG